jgi:hypothetical protein
MKYFLLVMAGIAVAPSAYAQAADPCTLVSREEAAAVLGVRVKPGVPAISGCQWGKESGEGSLQIEVAGARYYQSPPKPAKPIPGVGQEAYLYTELGGPHAIARTDKSVVVVWASDNTANSEKLVVLLRTLVGRVAAQQ